MIKHSNLLVESIATANSYSDSEQHYIYQHQHKEFPIIEPNTIVDPRTVVVHIQYTPVAG